MDRHGGGSYPAAAITRKTISAASEYLLGVYCIQTLFSIFSSSVISLMIFLQAMSIIFVLQMCIWKSLRM